MRDTCAALPINSPTDIPTDMPLTRERTRTGISTLNYLAWLRRRAGETTHSEVKARYIERHHEMTVVISLHRKGATK